MIDYIELLVTMVQESLPFCNVDVKEESLLDFGDYCVVLISYNNRGNQHKISWAVNSKMLEYKERLLSEFNAVAEKILYDLYKNKGGELELLLRHKV